MFFVAAGCVCSAEGTVNGGRCDDSTGSCHCKENVEGPHCDRCKRGYYGLSASNPLGCTSESSNTFYMHEEINDMNYQDSVKNKKNLLSSATRMADYNQQSHNNN